MKFIMVCGQLQIHFVQQNIIEPFMAKNNIVQDTLKKITPESKQFVSELLQYWKVLPRKMLLYYRKQAMYDYQDKRSYQISKQGK